MFHPIHTKMGSKSTVHDLSTDGHGDGIFFFFFFLYIVSWCRFAFAEARYLAHSVVEASSVRQSID